MLEAAVVSQGNSADGAFIPEVAEKLNQCQYIIPFTLTFYSTPNIIIRHCRLEPAAENS
jgi:hypothetical protein